MCTEAHARALIILQLSDIAIRKNFASNETHRNDSVTNLFEGKAWADDGVVSLFVVQGVVTG